MGFGVRSGGRPGTNVRWHKCYAQQCCNTPERSPHVARGGQLSFCVDRLRQSLRQLRHGLELVSQIAPVPEASEGGARRARGWGPEPVARAGPHHWSHFTKQRDSQEGGKAGRIFWFSEPSDVP